jgi:rRNA maturation RNase YbeY
LLKINEEYLKHDTLTDIISFDYSIGKELHGDIFISIERVRENAVDYRVEFTEELNRVMAHGILHYCGYNDKNKEDELVMRLKEDEKMSMFHVKHN